jgi:hypothetical protein
MTDEVQLNNILYNFPVYLCILSYISRCDCIMLSRTCKDIYNIMTEYGFLDRIDYKYSKKSVYLIKKHFRTLRYINFYKQKDVFSYLPVLNNKIELRLRDCREVKANKNKNVNESIYNMIILGEKHNLSIIDLNKFTNLINLGVEYINKGGTIKLNKLKSLKIYGNIDINNFNCEKLSELFYYVTKNNEMDIIDLIHFEKLEHITIFLSFYTKLKVIKIKNSVKNIKIIVNRTIYEKHFEDLTQVNKNFRQIKNITLINNFYVIKPVISMFDNLYYY